MKGASLNAAKDHIQNELKGNDELKKVVNDFDIDMPANRDFNHKMNKQLNESFGIGT